jgi:hypothetical protein
MAVRPSFDDELKEVALGFDPFSAAAHKINVEIDRIQTIPWLEQSGSLD